MGDTGINRGVYVTPSGEPVSPLPRLIGFVVFMILLVVVGVAAYKLLPALMASDTSKPTEEVKRLRAQVAELQQRLDTLEKRRRAPNEPPETEKAKLAAPAPQVVTRTVYRVTPATAEVTKPPLQKTAGPDPKVTNLERGLGSLQTDVAANREALQATTDRLSDIVGAVGTQQREIDQNRDALEDLRAKNSRNFLPFDVRRGMDRQAVGPIALLLKGADEKNQRYTVRVLVNDRWLEIKDLSLYEAVNLYLAGISTPLELVATRIRKNEVSGFLGVPQTKVKP